MVTSYILTDTKMVTSYILTDTKMVTSYILTDTNMVTSYILTDTKDGYLIHSDKIYYITVKLTYAKQRTRHHKTGPYKIQNWRAWQGEGFPGGHGKGRDSLEGMARGGIPWRAWQGEGFPGGHGKGRDSLEGMARGGIPWRAWQGEVSPWPI